MQHTAGWLPHTPEIDGSQANQLQCDTQHRVDLQSVGRHTEPQNHTCQAQQYTLHPGHGVTSTALPGCLMDSDDTAAGLADSAGLSKTSGTQQAQPTLRLSVLL